jgi:hypothetical protein
MVVVADHLVPHSLDDQVNRSISTERLVAALSGSFDATWRVSKVNPTDVLRLE